jgi:NADPH:quinone reductase-like Zn-dependent oxidoreductase
MKAYVLNEFGGVENLKLKEIEKPKISEKEVLIKVKAISINPVDVRTRAGYAMAEYLKKDMPLILGWDISGIVEEVGEKVTKFKTGDAVFGMINFLGHGKGYAEYVVASENHIAKKPDNVSFEEAASATLAALTAWQFLINDAMIKKGDRVLIQAASGGVGHFAVQIAKHFGAYVIGLASSKNKDFILSLGADEYISYDKQEVTDLVKNMDIVIDPFAKENLYKSLELTKKGGVIISLLPMIGEDIKEKAKEKNVKITYSLVDSNGENMRQIAELMEKGKIKSYVSKVFNFNEMDKAHLAMETGKTVGKIVIRI